MAPLNVKPAKDKLRNTVCVKLSDYELERLDKLVLEHGFDSRASFVHSCVMAFVRGTTVRY